MPRGGANQTKVHYKGKAEDFIIFVDDAKAAKDWLSDSSIPLVQVVSSFQVFVTDKHGAQGELNTASKSTLENEFGTSVDDEVLKKILKQGTLQETQDAERQGTKNDSMGARVAH